MSNDLFFDFKVDKAAKTVVVTRDFAAPQDMVWDAFTKAELLDKWVAPKPFSAKTKYANFEVGGKRFYAMCDAEGNPARWLVQKYTSITPKTNYKMFNVFADADENEDQFGSEWDFTFSELGDKTRIVVTIFNESFERMEMMLQMGFTEGFKASLVNLDELLAGLS